MADVYKDFQREPSNRTSACTSQRTTGARCRAMAMQNNYMCRPARRRPTVIENDMFLIDNLDTPRSHPEGLFGRRRPLACNHIDLKRAELLITLLRAASRNLRDAAAAAARPPRSRRRGQAAGAQFDGFIVDPGVKSRRPPSDCHPERSSDPFRIVILSVVRRPRRTQSKSLS